MGIYWILLIVFHVTLLVHSGNSCTMQATSDKDFVLLEETAQVNCTGTCKKMYLETRLSKSNGTKNDYFISTKVTVKDWELSPVQCMTELENGTVLKKEVTVIPYALPSSVVIDMRTELEEDKEHKVTCWMYEVAPLNRVMLSLTKGGNFLYNKTFESDTSRKPQNQSHTFNFIASRNDNQQDFTCQVTLNLTRVTNTTVQSNPITTLTYAMPEDPHITAERWIEHGMVENISCSVRNAFPSEKITTVLSVNAITHTNATGNTSVVSTLNTANLSMAEYNVVCKSQVYNFIRQSNMSIIIYEPPEMSLTLSKEVVTVGEMLTATCAIIQGNANYFGLSISVDGEEVQRVNAPDVVANISVTIRKPNLSVICKMFIQETQKELPRVEKRKNVTVHYPPRFTDHSCPEPMVWVEGDKRFSGCRSEANPMPEEWCSLSVLSLKSSTPFTAQRNMSGVHTCHASNAIENVTKSVKVIVEYSPGRPTVEISSSSINAGGSVNLTCHSDALPAPVYSWETPPHAQVVFSKDQSSITITDASSYHDGTYICHVKNRHGELSAQRSLQVQRDHSILIAILIGVGISIFLVILVGLASYFLCQKGKKGFYDLVRRKAGNPKDTNIPLCENGSA